MSGGRSPSEHRRLWQITLGTRETRAWLAVAETQVAQGLRYFSESLLILAMLIRDLFDHHNRAEGTGQIVVRSSCEEQSVSAAVGRVAPSEIDRPQLIDADELARNIFHRRYEPSIGVEAVDESTVSVVGDQNRIAEPPEIRWRDRESPGLIELRCLREESYQGPILFVNVNESARASR
jgi:hypothetical protein